MIILFVCAYSVMLGLELVLVSAKVEQLEFCKQNVF